MEQQIDKINYGGNTYEFVDQEARDANTALSQRVGRLNDAQTDALKTEAQRAADAEKALENAKVSKEAGKGLSSNDFTNTYKEKLDNPAAMTGATAMTDGKQGDVPAPAKGQQELYLDGSGTWSKPHDTTYDEATQKVSGLMSATDKKKLDNIDTSQDDVSASNTVFNDDGSITETLGNGKVKQTTFNNDGSITQKITNAAGTTLTLNTTFNEDGSITRTVT